MAEFKKAEPKPEHLASDIRSMVMDLVSNSISVTARKDNDKLGFNVIASRGEKSVECFIPLHTLEKMDSVEEVRAVAAHIATQL